jgi:hypothetical protein
MNNGKQREVSPVCVAKVTQGNWLSHCHRMGVNRQEVRQNNQGLAVRPILDRAYRPAVIIATDCSESSIDCEGKMPR